MTEESQTPSNPAAAAAAGGEPGPAPRSQQPDQGAGSGCPDHQVEGGGTKSEAGAEGNESPGSWRGRLTARDRELMGHLGLVRYLRTGQIAEMIFPGRAQSVVSERLG